MTEPVTGIEVSGIGTAAMRPDIARVVIAVSIRQDTVTEASERSRSLSSAILDELTAAGVDKSDVSTVNYSIHPDYDYPDGRQRLLGYRVTNEIQVTIRDLTAVGSTIDRAVAAAGDTATVNRLAFEIEDERQARDRAREVAWADALERAEQLATLSGRPLGLVTSIVESPGGGPAPRLMAASVAEDSTPIESGTTTLTVRLQARFAFE